MVDNTFMASFTASINNTPSIRNCSPDFLDIGEFNTVSEIVNHTSPTLDLTIMY